MEHLKLNDNQKFEAIKYRHEDQSRLLQKISDVDLKLFTGIVTIQLILGGFISNDISKFENIIIKIGLLSIDLAICIICGSLLYKNYKRREEAVRTLKNCNQALGFNEKEYYISGAINAQGENINWLWHYILAVCVSFIGIGLLLFSNEIYSFLILK